MRNLIKNKLVKNYIYNSMYQVISIIVPIITIPYVSRILGVKGLGIYGYTYSVAQFFYILGMFGISSYGSRQIAYIRNDKNKTTTEFWNIWILQCITGITSLLIFMIIIVYLDMLNYKQAFLLQIPLILNSILDITWIFVGMEDFKKTVTRSISIRIIGLFLIFMFIKETTDVYLYIIVNSIVTLLGSLTLWIFVKQYVGKLEFKNIKLKNHIKGAFYMLIPQLSVQVYTSLDKTLVGTLSNVNQVGYYDQSQKIARIALAIVTSLSVILMPRIANMHAKNELKRLEEYITKSVNFTLASSIFIMSTIIGISKNFVPWFFGKQFDVIIPYMMITSLIILFISLGGVFANQYTLPTSKNKEYIIPLLLASIINVTLNVILVPKFEALGGVIAIVITEFIVCMLRIILVRKYLDIKTIFRHTYVYYIAGFTSAISVYFLGNFIKGNFLGLLVQGGLGLIIYVLFLYFIDNPIKYEIKNRLIYKK